MQMLAAAGSITSQSGGGYTLPPTAAYFPMAAYTTIQQQQQQQLSSSQPPGSLQQPANVQSSQSHQQATANTSSAVPMSAALNVVDTAAPSTSKPIDVTPSVTQPNTPDLLIHRRQVRRNNYLMNNKIFLKELQRTYTQL